VGWTRFFAYFVYGALTRFTYINDEEGRKDPEASNGPHLRQLIEKPEAETPR
jgi:hypothetical protein